MWNCFKGFKWQLAPPLLITSFRLNVISTIHVIHKFPFECDYKYTLYTYRLPSQKLELVQERPSAITAISDDENANKEINENSAKLPKEHDT